MASKVIRIFDKVNKDPKEAWFISSLSDVNNRINSAEIPTNAVISKVKIYVNADFDGGGIGAKVYLQFGFGSQGSISTSLMGDTKIDKELYNYPSDTGVEISSTYIKTTSPFGFKDSIGANFVAYIHTGNILVTELTVNYAEVVVEYSIPTYTSTFKNYDGTTLQTVQVERGSTPSYTGSTPTRAQDAQYTYAFSGWSPAVGAVTGNITYTAQFTPTKRKYKVTVVASPSAGGDVTGGNNYEYGTSITITADAKANYIFTGWNDGVLTPSRTVTVTGNVTYTAYFELARINLILVDKSQSLGVVVDVDTEDNDVVYVDLTKVYG